MLQIIVSYRLARIGYTRDLIASGLIGNLFVFLTRYFSYAEFTAHVAISVNRFQAIARPNPSSVSGGFEIPK